MDATEQEKARTEALNAYLAILGQHGASRAELAKSRHVVLYLLNKLKGRALGGAEYREAVDAMLADIGGGDRGHFCLTVAREFYGFACRDVKAVARIVATGGYSGRSAEAAPIPWRDIDQGIAEAEARPLGGREGAVYRRYLDLLRQQGASEAVLETRGKLAKVLLAVTQGAVANGDGYRAAIDRLLPLFTKHETRLYFLAVAREFYYCLTGARDAGQAIAGAGLEAAAHDESVDDLTRRERG